MAMQGVRPQGAVVHMARRSRHAGGRWAARRGNGGLDPERMARGLGWFSIGLGVVEILAPRMFARSIGLKGQGASRTVTRLVGLREIASGVGILRERRPVGWVWSRVVGDVMDLALLGAGFTAHRANRKRLTAAAAGVLGVTVLDALCAEQLSALSRLSVRLEKDGTLRVRKRITVGRPAEALYRFWRDFSNLHRFMDKVESVQATGDRRTHWKAKGPAGVTVEWDAELTDDRPNELIAWRSVDHLPFRHSGIVRFEPAPAGRGTTVTVEMEYTPPGGTLTAAAAKLIGYAPEQQLHEDLRCFKQLMETGQVALSESMITGVARPPETPSRSAVMAGTRGGAR